MTWEDLFDRAAGVETTVAEIRETLDGDREDGDDE